MQWAIYLNRMIRFESKRFTPVLDFLWAEKAAAREKEIRFGWKVKPLNTKKSRG